MGGDYHARRHARRGGYLHRAGADRVAAAIRRQPIFWPLRRQKPCIHARGMAVSAMPDRWRSSLASRNRLMRFTGSRNPLRPRRSPPDPAAQENGRCVAPRLCQSHVRHMCLTSRSDPRFGLAQMQHQFACKIGQGEGESARAGDVTTVQPGRGYAVSGAAKVQDRDPAGQGA